MDKGLGILYHKLTNLLHVNPSISNASTTSPVAKPTTSLPNSTFFDRLTPSSASSTVISHNNDRYYTRSCVTCQTSIKADEDHLSLHTIPICTQKMPQMNIIKQQR